MRGSFSNGVEVRSEIPYLALMRNNDRVFTFYEDTRGCNGIILSGFDVAHDGPGAAGLVIHIDGAGFNSVRNITIKNNIIHDSYNNDLLKINNACTDILVEGNMFYNQTGSDEHIDINSVENVTVHNNVFFNDFAGSGRTNSNNTSSYIVIKDSNGSGDIFTGSRNVSVSKNIFLNWEGSTGSNFILCGEDGQSFFEAQEVLIENNLMLGNAVNVMRAAFGVKGCKNITFRHNTIVGDLPSLAFAFRFNQEGQNQVNENISCYNNIWSDPTGTMGASFGGANDFSDTPMGETNGWILSHNCYWNGGSSIPIDAGELINYTDDTNRVVASPMLNYSPAISIPRWNAGTFADGSTTIAEVFVKLVQDHGVIADQSLAKNTANGMQSPVDDILGQPRTNPDIGAYEVPLSTCASNPVNNWIGANGHWYESVYNWSLGRWPEPCDHVLLPVSVSVAVMPGDTARAYTLDVPPTSALEVPKTAHLEVRTK